ncbi:MAG: hypothetical protein AAF226_08835 [Verrucomicrobiota bacterium]
MAGTSLETPPDLEPRTGAPEPGQVGIAGTSLETPRDLEPRTGAPEPGQVGIAGTSLEIPPVGAGLECEKR